ncbi:peptidylprolyl isomerase [Mesorhizobium australicum]|uniref:Parvulin-like PPIase n=1 Tax=Mesorhizobium australicum TaxID=536018 RepID=A0A1X7PTQ5_9HYPH|nr:peptidylprolyl isomerase [Mesorhizobium australicum]SMH54958.1 peptidyl-prolyl cis-trans isomerase C [Mesorhizobium australicum]
MNITLRKRPAARVALALGLLASATFGALAQADTVVATVSGQPVTEADVQMAVSELDQQFAQLTPEQKRAAALSAIIEIRLMAEKARAAKLDQDDEFKRKLAFLNDRALHAQVIEKEISPKVTDEDLKARYDKEIAARPPVEEVHARHILVKTEEEAKDVIKRLDEGGDFQAIAKEKSDDPGSGANGGDLGFFSKGQMVPEFEAAAFALEPGSYTKTPVKSEFGFHVIKVEEKRTQPPVPFDQVKDQIRQLVFRDLYFATVKDLRAGAQVEIKDEALKKGVEEIEKQAGAAE